MVGSRLAACGRLNDKLERAKSPRQPDFEVRSKRKLGFFIAMADSSHKPEKATDRLPKLHAENGPT